MKKLILLVLVSLSTILSSAQCSANFTWTVSGNTIQFNNTSSGTTNNDWSFGDGTNSNQTNPSHAYSAAGTYNVCLFSYYQDSTGNFCSDSICQQITVIDSTGTGCSVNANIFGSNGQIIGNNTSTGTSVYSWTVSDYNTGVSLYNSSTQNLNYTPGYSGNFWVCLTAYEANGNVCDTLCDIVTVIDSSGTGCSVSANLYGSNGQIIGHNTSTGTSVYSWTVSDYNTGVSLYNSSTQNLSYTPGYNGNFWVCLTAYEANGNVCDTLCDIVTVIDSSGTGCSVSANIFASNGQIIGNNTSTSASVYSWTVSDYNTGVSLYNSSSQNLNYTPGYNGNFWVCLTAYEANGNVCDTLCDIVTIIDSSGTGCSVSANIFASNGQIIGNNTSTSASAFSWTVSDYNTGVSLYSSSAQNLSYAPGYNGNFWVCLTAYEANGNVCDTLCDIVTVIDSSGTGCSVNANIFASNGQIIGNNTSTSASAFSWTVSDYNTGVSLYNSSTQNLNYTPGYSGNFWVCLTAYEANGNVCDTLCDLVTVIDSSGTGCSVNANIFASNEQIIGNNTSTSASAFSWTVSDYNTGVSLYNSTSQNLNYTPGYNGNFWVCLTAYEANGNVCDTLCDIVTVIDSSGTGCSVSANIYGSNGQILGYSTSTGASVYSWTVSDYNTGVTLNSSQSTNLSYFPGYFGDFLVCLTAYEANGNICATLCDIVSIIDSSGTGCTINTWIYAQSGEIIGTNNSTGASAYEWTVYDANNWSTLNTTTSTNLSYTPGYFGDFFVCLTAFDTTGNICDSLCQNLSVLPDSLSTTVSVVQLSMDEIQVYPNPTSSVINIQFDQLPSNSHALIVDMLGREMIEVDLTTQVTEVQVAEFPRGIYLVQLFDANNRIIGMSKFVRE